jgi:hypothetical protein
MLKRDIESQEFLHGVEQKFWRLVDQIDELVYVELIAPDDRLYIAEFDCTGYDTDPVKCRFVERESHVCKEEAWPIGDGPFAGWVKWTAPHFFICWNQDRQGIAHHPDWRPQEAWKKTPNKIVGYLEFLQKLLYVPENGYRRKSL